MDDDDTTPARRYSTFPDGEHRDGGGTEEAGAPVVSRRRGARPRDGLPGHPLPPPSPAPWIRASLLLSSSAAASAPRRRHPTAPPSQTCRRGTSGSIKKHLTLL